MGFETIFTKSDKNFFEKIWHNVKEAFSFFPKKTSGVVTDGVQSMVKTVTKPLFLIVIILVLVLIFWAKIQKSFVRMI